MVTKPIHKFIMTSHVISEVDCNPYWDWIHFWSLAWLIPERTRKLKPSAGMNRKPKVIQVRKCDLLVQVVSAKNIPVKVNKDGSVAAVRINNKGKKTTGKRGKSRRRFDEEEDDDSAEEDSEEEDGWGQDHTAESETFVEVRFQETSARTTSVTGKAPLWKQTLKLPFKAPPGPFRLGPLTGPGPF